MSCPTLEHQARLGVITLAFFTQPNHGLKVAIAEGDRRVLVGDPLFPDEIGKELFVRVSIAKGNPPRTISFRIANPSAGQSVARFEGDGREFDVEVRYDHPAEADLGFVLVGAELWVYDASSGIYLGSISFVDKQSMADFIDEDVEYALHQYDLPSSPTVPSVHRAKPKFEPPHPGPHLEDVLHPRVYSRSAPSPAALADLPPPPAPGQLTPQDVAKLRALIPVIDQAIREYDPKKPGRGYLIVELPYGQSCTTAMLDAVRARYLPTGHWREIKSGDDQRGADWLEFYPSR